MDAPGEKLLIRLWDTVENAIGGLLSPWHTRRKGRAIADVRREELLTLAQAEQDVTDIRAGRKRFGADHQLVEGSESDNEAFSPGDLTAATLAAAAQRSLVVQQMRAEVNVAKAVLSAEAELEDDRQEPPDRSVDEDWLVRWRESASKVSAAELQALWGRVLAGEIKSPGAFSLRTLEFLKNLSPEDAHRIEKLAPFVVNNDFVFAGDRSLLDSEGVALGFLLDLRDLGIVDLGAARGLTKLLKSATPNEFLLGLVSYTLVLVVTHEDPTKEISLSVYRLTSLGKEVLKLGAFTPHDTYIRYLGRTIRDRGFKVVLARYEQVTETEGRYFDGEDL